MRLLTSLFRTELSSTRLSSERLVATDNGATTPPVASLAHEGTLPRLLAAYLRVMPGGAAWLQAAIGSQLQAVVAASEDGMCLLTDAMDAYVSLPAAAKAEIDRDVRRRQLEHASAQSTSRIPPAE